jgi:hypothetical protein
VKLQKNMKLPVKLKRDIRKTKYCYRYRKDIEKRNTGRDIACRWRH